MNSLSLGDLANSFMLQQRSSALKTELSKLTTELASGQVSDVKSVLAGNLSYLTDIENGLSTLQGYKVSSAEAAQFTNAMQTVLETVQETSSTFGANLILVTNGNLDSVAVQSSSEAFELLKSTIGTLNSDFAGRSLFSGAATDQPALGSADQLIADLRAEVTGVVGSTSKIAAIESWFDDPAGFDSSFYGGSTTNITPFKVSDSEELFIEIRATDPAIKDTLKNFALAALAADDILNIDHVERKDLLLAAGEGLLQNQEGVTGLRTQVGFLESRIEVASTQNESERLSLEYDKGSLLEADPYETAIRLEEVQFQLQSLYSVTVRTSQLSLVNFL